MFKFFNESCKNYDANLFCLSYFRSINWEIFAEDVFVSLNFKIAKKVLKHFGWDDREWHNS